jgi:hypothetical protein
MHGPESKTEMEVKFCYTKRSHQIKSMKQMPTASAVCGVETEYRTTEKVETPSNSER